MDNRDQLCIKADNKDYLWIMKVILEQQWSSVSAYWWMIGLTPDDMCTMSVGNRREKTGKSLISFILNLLDFTEHIPMDRPSEEHKNSKNKIKRSTGKYYLYHS